jgi:diacylglycerol kinase family enzyme
MSPFRRSVLVYNPASGKGKATSRAADFATAFRDRFGSELTLRPTESVADIREAAKQAVAEYELQLFMGGDGTLSEALQGMCELSDFRPLERAVGLLPAGSGNSFLRDFGIVTYPAARDALLSALASGETVAADLAVVRYSPPGELGVDKEARRISFQFWGIGLVCDIAERAMQMRYLGSLNYAVAAVGKVLNHRPYRWLTTIDGVTEEIECNFLSVSNSRFTGGAMMIAPPVRINDGRLFLVLPSIRSRVEMLRMMPKIFRGRHLDHPQVNCRFVSEVSIQHDQPLVFNVDGELDIGHNPSIAVQPGFWQVYMSPERLLD